MIRWHSTITILTSLVLVLGFEASTAASSAPSRSADQAKLQRALDDVVASGVPGAILLVRKGDQTVRVTSGYRNMETKAPMRATDRFRVGSVTKTFVATVVLQLAGERKLSLDDSVEHWLPGLVPNAQNVTIRQLLNMTSGLFNYSDDPRITRPYEAGNFGYVWSPRRLVAVAVSHGPNFEPGTSWEYSNTNYILLGLIVEKASGHSIGVELSTRIFVPLHLRGTSFDTTRRMAGQYSHGYYRKGKQLIDTSLLSPSHAWAAGAMVSTADDLASFFRALSRGRLIRPDLIREMRKTVGSSGYGLGLALLPLPCGAMWGNHGETIGYSADAWGTSDARRQFVLFVSLDSSSRSKPSEKALAKVRAAAYCGRGS